MTKTAEIRGQRDRENLSDEGVDVPGSARSRLIEATLTGDEQGVSVPVRQFDLFALTASDDIVYVVYNAAEEDFDRNVAQPVVESVEVR